MNVHAAVEFSQPSLPFAPGYGERSSGDCDRALSGLSESGTGVGSPRLIRSVVSEAGLGRFVYLQGKSGRRYVFSSISAEQAPLYDRALFATINPQNGAVTMFDADEQFSGFPGTLYVHFHNDSGGDTLESSKLDLNVG